MEDIEVTQAIEAGEVTAAEVAAAPVEDLADDGDASATAAEEDQDRLANAAGNNDSIDVDR